MALFAGFDIILWSARTPVTRRNRRDSDYLLFIAGTCAYRFACYDFCCHCSAPVPCPIFNRDARARSANTESDYFIIINFYNKFSVIIITILTLVDANILHFFFSFSVYTLHRLFIINMGRGERASEAQENERDHRLLIEVSAFVFSTFEIQRIESSNGDGAATGRFFFRSRDSSVCYIILIGQTSLCNIYVFNALNGYFRRWYRHAEHTGHNNNGQTWIP